MNLREDELALHMTRGGAIYNPNRHMPMIRAGQETGGLGDGFLDLSCCRRRSTLGLGAARPGQRAVGRGTTKRHGPVGYSPGEPAIRHLLIPLYFCFLCRCHVTF
ncbi:hypothetical protein TCAP_03131 [Tolypocladium capitatum]|uniref:Uncharacterized protein n=1 Tax=Tolypocladium capitatum TaxID=45235 RepID=A0A2K3QHD2_9HYPO|nr:hypothetical protein TCAP_03131 [Tolypocladium capitatum]